MRILLVGLTARAIAESALRSGRDVVTVDYFGDLDTTRLAPNVSLRERGTGYSAQALVRVARELAYDAVAYAGGLENHPDAVEALAEGKSLLGNAPGTLRRVRDPTQLFPFLRARGFAVPRTIPSGERPPPGLSATGRWLVKPVASGGGHGVRAWRGAPPAPRHIVQEYVAGTPASAVFVADGRRAVLLGWSEQLHAPSAFRYGGNLLPLAAPAATIEELRRLVQALTDGFGLVGLNGVDFVLKEGRPFVVEVNPRYSASMELVERAIGLPVFDLHVEACGGRLPEPAAARPALHAGPPGAVHGKAIVYAPRGVTVTASLDWIERGVRDVPHVGEVIARGRPICTVLARAPSRDACLVALRAQEAEIIAACEPS